jgi:LPS sulfotransferase NodH
VSDSTQFHATGREPIRVFYDEFTVSRSATIGRVLDALGIDPPAPESKKPMKRQTDDPSSDWWLVSGPSANNTSESEDRYR